MGMLLQWAGPLMVPQIPPVEIAVAPNFERFDGLGQPQLDHPAGESQGGGAAYGWDQPQHSPRPGQSDQPTGQTYTPGPITGVVGTIGGQPLPTSDRMFRPPGAYTGAVPLSVQHRLGVGQYGPSSLGIQNTTQLSEITNSPPQPGDIASIIAGLG
jgi:hypothetical protein